MNQDVVYLDLSTWIGLSPGAVHWYGRLKGYNGIKRHRVDLRYSLTITQAKKVSRRDYTYREGMMYSAFDDQEAAIAFAKSVWREHFPNAKALVVGSSSINQPCRIVVPEEYDAPSTALVEAFDALYGDSYDPSSWEEYYRLAGEYDALLASALTPKV